jgi:hypothetical protein
LKKSDFIESIALIVVSGHLGLFVLGGLVLVLGSHSATDVAHMMLMGTPLLLIFAGNAYTAMFKPVQTDDNEATYSPKLVRLTRIILYCFLVVLFVIYSAALFDRSGFEIENLKTAVGIVESSVAGYLSIISNQLFGAQIDRNRVAGTVKAENDDK